MRHRSPVIEAAAIAVATLFAFTLQAADLPKVRVLATGGTIAGAQASATDYGYRSAPTT